MKKVDSLPGTEYGYTQLSELAELVMNSGNILNGYTADNEALYEQLHGMNQAAAEVLTEIDGVSAVFGVGFPYYSFDRESGLILPPTEYGDFVLEQGKRIWEAADAQKAGSWACSICVSINDLPDLKKNCKPCEVSEFKPRELFRVLPDLDLIVVVDSDDQQTLESIETNLNAAGFVQSDTDIDGCVRRTQQSIKELLEGAENPTPLPMDLHVVSEKDFLATVEKLPEFPNESAKVMAMYKNWPRVEIDLLFDILFSLTPVKNTSDRIANAVQLGMEKLIRTKTDEEIMEMIATRGPRKERLMKDENVRDLFTQRIDAIAEGRFEWK